MLRGVVVIVDARRLILVGWLLCHYSFTQVQTPVQETEPYTPPKTAT